MQTAPRRLSRPYAAVVSVLSAACLLIFLDVRTRALLVNSLWLAALTCIVVIPAGLLLATALAKFALPGRRIAWILLVSGLFLPLYLVATAWQAALGIQGWITQLLPASGAAAPILSGWTGAVFIHAVALLPVVTLLIAAGLAWVERELEEDALLYAPPHVVLFRVTWRRSLGAIFTAAVWVFVVCFGEMTVTDLFQIRTFAEEIYVQTAGGAVWNLAGMPGVRAPSGWLAGEPSRGSFIAGTLLLLATFIFAIWICLSVASRWHRVGVRRAWVMELRRGGWLVGACVVLILMAITGIPLGSLFYQAGIYVERQESAFVSSWSLAKALSTVVRAPALHRDELLASAIVASAAAAVAMLSAAVLGVWSMSRQSGKAISTMVASTLAAVPGPLLGLWIIRVLNQPPDSPVSFLAVLYDEAAFGFAPWLAQTLRVLPFAIIVLVPALGRTPRALLDTAAIDGVGPVRKVVHIFVPLHWRAMAVAWLVAFVLAAGELSATVLVAPPGVTPLAVRIFNLVHYGVDDQLAGLVLFVWASVLGVTVAVFLLAGRVGRPKL